MSKQGKISLFAAGRLLARFAAEESKESGGEHEPGHFATIDGHAVFFPDSEIKDSDHAADHAGRMGFSEGAQKQIAKAHAEGRVKTTAHLMEVSRHAKNLQKHGLKESVAVKTALDIVKPKDPKKATEPDGSSSVKEVSPHDIAADPGRFQYKVNVGSTGTNSELKGVKKWNENLGGVVLTWKDPADGKEYVINGHHRLELAQRLDVGKIAVRRIKASDAAEARYIGAVANIAEGRGTAIDAGKLLRDDKVTPEKLAEDGVSLKGKLASDGMALSKLPEALWNKAYKGEITTARAVAIGGSGLNQSNQLLLSQTVEKQEKKGKRLTDKEVGELAEQIKNAGSTSVTQSNLFGDEAMEQNLFVEKAQLSSYLKDRLGKDRRLFGYVGNSSRAEALAKGGNSINVSESQRIAEHAAQMEDLFSHLAYRSGPVADALTKAATRLAQGGSSSEVKSQLYDQVRDAVAQVMGKAVKDHESSHPEEAKEPEDKHTMSMFSAFRLFAQFAAERDQQGFVDFSRADFSEGEHVVVPALLSRTGNYADKGIELTRQDFDRASRYVSPASAVPMNMAHLRRGTVLDGAGLGQIERTWRRGDELWGEISVPKWLASLARERGLKLPVSAEWDIKTKTLKGCAWERTPRIEDAKALLN